MQPIIVGLDESETARRAVTKAAQLAADLGAPLHLVMCVSRNSRNVTIGGESYHFDSVSSTEQFLDALAAQLPTVPELTRTISFDDPATTICDEATRLDARMIVVGNRRVKGIARVLGSVASDITRHAPCDVLVANTTGPQD